MPARFALERGGKEIRNFGGRQVVDVEVIELDPPARFRFVTKSGPLFNDRAYDLEPTPDGGTRLTFTFEMVPTALPMKVLFPLLRRTIATQVQVNIERLRTILSAAQDPTTAQPAT